MQKLGLADASFLHFERPGACMNIGSLQRFAKPAGFTDMAAFHRRLRRYLATRVHAVSFMTARLKRTPLDLDQPVWARDGHFRIDHHLFRTRVPPPGNTRQLCALVARLHEQPLNRNRPLWEMHLIDGLEDGSFALYSKYHHGAIDGMAGQKIMDVLYSDSPHSDPPPQTLPAAEHTGAGRLVFDALVNLALQPAAHLAAAAEQLAAAARVGERLWNDREGALTLVAPRTPFNVRVSPYRTFANASLPLPELRALGRRAGVSANDVLLTVCAGGLRRYLAQHQALPADPLIAGIPVSLRRRGGATRFNNQVAMLRASLETREADPRKRLAAISRSTRLSKGLLNDARGLVADDVHLPGLEWMSRSASAVAARLPWPSLISPLCNLVVSNVPGPRRTRYLLGAEMLTHYPVSIATDAAALNLTAQSYGQRLDLGITACLEAVPDVEFLRDQIMAAWVELRDAFATELFQAA